MKKSLPFPFSFLFTFCFFLPVLSNLRAMQSPQDIPNLSADATSSTPDSPGPVQLLKTYGIPVTPNTLQALAKYSSPLERKKLAGILKENPRHADNLSQLIVEGTLDPHTDTTPEDFTTATSLLDAGFSVPPNFTEVRRTLGSNPYGNSLQNIIIISRILDPDLQTAEGSLNANLIAAYEIELRLLRESLLNKGLPLKSQKALRRRGLIVKDLPLNGGPSSFSQQLFELNTDPLTTLKRLYFHQKEILKEEAQLDQMDPASQEAQDLKKHIQERKEALEFFPKDIVQRYTALMDQRQHLLLHPTSSSHRKLNEIDEELMSIAFQKHFRNSYVESTLNLHPRESEKRHWLKVDLLGNLSAEEFSGAERAHIKGIKGKGSSILIIEPLLNLEDPGPFSKTSILPGSLDHALAVENIALQVAPHADISVRKYIKDLTSPQEIREALYSYELGPDFGSPAKIINLSLSSPTLSHTLKILHSSGNHLFVLAAGNQGKRMEEHGLFNPDFYDPSALDSVGNNIIFAGNLTRHFNKASSSNFPDFFQSDPKNLYYFQNRFLFTLGSNVPVRKFYPTYTPASGTSLAAPVISGAAALLQSAYPSFSMSDIQTILLESADKNFMMQTSLPQAPEAYTYVYDPFDPQNKDLKASRNVTLKHFDPAVFGKGVLSIRRALIYAQIYNRLKEENPHLPPEELKELTNQEFQKFMLIEHKTKGRILLRALQRFLAHQRASGVPPSVKPKTPKKWPPPIKPRPRQPTPHSVPPPHSKSSEKPSLPEKQNPPHFGSVRDKIHHFNQMRSHSSS